MFGVKLQLVELEIGEAPGEFEQRFEPGHATPRNVEHHATTREIRPVVDYQAGQAAVVLPQQLSHCCHGHPQASGFAEFNSYAFAINRDRVAFGMVGRGIAANNGERRNPVLIRQRELARKQLQ